MKRTEFFFKITVFFMIFTACIFSSCGAVKNCDEIGGEFYNFIKTERFEGVTELVDSEAFKVTPEEMWIENLEKKRHDAGQLLNVRRIDFETLTSDRVTRVGIWYKAVYTRAELFEKLEFIEREDGYKITFYQFDVDSLAVR